MIIVTKEFRKELRGFSHGLLDEIISLIRKYHRGLHTNLFEIQDYGGYILLKGYLSGKNIRLLVARSHEPYYVPLELFRKESRSGWNIREDFDIEIPMKKAEKCMKEKMFETFTLE